MTRVALDSNVLAYLAGVLRVPDDRPKIAKTRELIADLSTRTHLIAPVQALGELFVVLRRCGASEVEARELLLEIAQAFGSAATELRTATAAADLVADHKLQFWDSLILSAAVDAGCSILLSEDIQSGFVVRGLTIVDPFAKPVHPKLAQLRATFESGVEADGGSA